MNTKEDQDELLRVHTYETQVTVQNTNNQRYDRSGVFSPRRYMLSPTALPFTHSQGISNGGQIKSTASKVTRNRKDYQIMFARTILYQAVRNSVFEIPLEKSRNAMQDHRANHNAMTSFLQRRLTFPS